MSPGERHTRVSSTRPFSRRTEGRVLTQAVDKTTLQPASTNDSQVTFVIANAEGGEELPIPELCSRVSFHGCSSGRFQLRARGLGRSRGPLQPRSQRLWRSRRYEGLRFGAELFGARSKRRRGAIRRPGCSGG